MNGLTRFGCRGLTGASSLLEVSWLVPGMGSVGSPRPVEIPLPIGSWSVQIAFFELAARILQQVASTHASLAAKETP
jgi:hypothetical protein